MPHVGQATRQGWCRDYAYDRPPRPPSRPAILLHQPHTGGDNLALVMVIAVAALGLAIGGQAAASLFFVALTVLRSGLTVTTRYVASA
jgi:hypothetical protein